MQSIFDHFSHHRGNLCDLVSVRFWIFACQGMPTLAASFRFDVMTLLDLLYRHQLPRRTLMTWLCPALALALGSLACLGRHIRPIAGGWLGGVVRVALDPLPEVKRRKISRETLDIYAPLAHRFGMAGVKAELEDLAFKFLEPEDYASLAKKVAARKAARAELVERMREPLQRELERYHIAIDLAGQAASPPIPA